MSEIITELNDLFEPLGPIDLTEIILLPLCHTTSTGKPLSEIVKKQALKSNLSQDYGEDLIFFFYGKAKYFPKKDVQNHFGSYSPITFLFNLDSFSDSPYRMVPFDSGGFILYDMNGYEVKDFSIENVNEEKIKMLIKTFYTSNQNYINNQFTLNPVDYPLCDLIKKIHILHSKPMSGQSTGYGNQAFTIELQYKVESLTLKPIATFLPVSFFTSDSGKSQLEKAFPTSVLVPYRNNSATMIDEYGQMENAVKIFIEENYKINN